MKYLLLALALAACENPIEHFTEPPPKPKEVVIEYCPVDSLAPRDTVRCTR